MFGTDKTCLSHNTANGELICPSELWKIVPTQCNPYYGQSDDIGCEIEKWSISAIRRSCVDCWWSETLEIHSKTCFYYLEMIWDRSEHSGSQKPPQNFLIRESTLLDSVSLMHNFSAVSQFVEAQRTGFDANYRSKRLVLQDNNNWCKFIIYWLSVSPIDLYFGQFGAIPSCIW